MAAPTRTDITLAGSANANQPARLVLTAATDWAWPADLGTDCLNCYFEHNGTRIKHWFEDSRRARASVWLNSPNPIVAGDTLTLVSGVSRPRTKPTPESVGLVAGFNFNDPLTIAIERTPTVVVAANTTPTDAGEATFWNMVPRVWRMASGKIGMVCMGGASGEQVAPKYVVYAQSTNEGRTWGTPKLLVATPASLDFATPAACFAYDGKDYVVFAVGEDFEPKDAFYITESDDDGTTWGTPAAITGLDVVGTGGNNDTVKLSAKWGNKILFSNHLLDGAAYSAYMNVCDPAVDVTEWEQFTMSLDPDGVAVQEPAVVELPDGTLFALLRTSRGVLYETRTQVIGDFESWTTPIPTVMPNPNSKPDLCWLPDGRLGLLNNWNVAPTTSAPGTRRDMILAISSDNGRTFDEFVGVDGVQQRGAQYASAIANEEDGLTILFAGLAASTATHRTIFCQRIGRAELLTGSNVVGTGGGGMHRSTTGLQRRLATEAVKIPPKRLNGDEFPLYVYCRVIPRGDYPRENVVAILQHSDGDVGGTMSWVMAIGGDANANGWQWKLNPYKTSFLTTAKTANLNAENELEVFIVSATEHYTKINTTRVPSGTTMRAVHDTGALARQVVFGSPNYGDFPDPRGAAMAGGSYQEYISAVVCHDPAFLTGALD